MATDYSTGGLTAGAVPPDALADLSLRQLLSFRAVADEGSFHGAADALDYTQSAVSQHVMALEAALGVRLVRPLAGRRTVELTEAGRLLLAPRRDDHGPPPGGTRRPPRLRGRGDGHAARRRVSERWDPGAAGDHRALRARRGPASRCSSPRPTATRACSSFVEPGRARPVVRRAAAPGGPVRGGRAPPGPVRAGHGGERAARRPLGHAVDRAHRGPAADRLPVVPEHALGRAVPARARAAEPNFVFRSEDNGTVQAMVGAGLGTALVPLLAVDTAGPVGRGSSRPTCRRVASP